MVALSDEGHHGELEELDEFAERGGKDGVGAAEGVASLGIEGHDFATLLDLTELPHESGVVGELTLGDASHARHQPLEYASYAHKAVDGHDVVGLIGEGRLDGHHKIVESIVVAQQEVGSLDALHIDSLDARAVEPGHGE